METTKKWMIAAGAIAAVRDLAELPVVPVGEAQLERRLKDIREVLESAETLIAALGDR